MANICVQNMPAGVNRDCQKFLAKVSNVIICQAGTTFTLANFPLKAPWVTAVQGDLSAYVTQLAGYDVTTDDPEVQTTQTGQKLVTQTFAPSMTAYLNLSTCDFREVLKTVKGGRYDVFLVMQDGTVMGWVSDGVVRGFSCNVYAVNKGIPAPDNLWQFNRVDFYFQNISEFDEFILDKPTFNIVNDLWLAMPNGLDLRVVSYDGDDIEVVITERCGDVVEDLVLGDFEVTDSNSTATITAVTDNDGGSYTIAYALTANEYGTIRVNSIASSVTTDISTRITVSA